MPKTKILTSLLQFHTLLLCCAYIDKYCNQKSMEINIRKAPLLMEV